MLVSILFYSFSFFTPMSKRAFMNQSWPEIVAHSLHMECRPSFIPTNFYVWPLLLSLADLESQRSAVVCLDLSPFYLQSQTLHQSLSLGFAFDIASTLYQCWEEAHSSNQDSIKRQGWLNHFRYQIIRRSSDSTTFAIYDRLMQKN